MNNFLISIAPMLGMTNRHCRYLHRLLTKHALLYSEMLSTNAILNRRNDKFLQYSPMERPLALQLAGCIPRDLAVCAKLAENFGYDEVNMNVGCPSKRIRKANFGVRLMLQPDLVVECLAAMIQEVSIPVSVKIRLGVDGYYSYAGLVEFIEKIIAAGCCKVIIHARLACLTKLTPKQNRSAPALQYQIVHQLQQQFPKLTIIINGGLTNLQDIEQQLQHVSGVMIGRAAYYNPYMLADIDREFYGEAAKIPSRRDVIDVYMNYMEEQIAEDKLSRLIRPVLGLFRGVEGAGLWRQKVSKELQNSCGSLDVIKYTLQQVVSESV